MVFRERELTDGETAHIETAVRSIGFSEKPKRYIDVVDRLFLDLRRNPIPKVEQTLRGMGSKVYLLAMPAELREDGLSLLPHTGRRTYPSSFISVKERRGR